jgi:DNA-binding beta-propeller fold protein YncE
VADTSNNRIQKFDANGNFLTKWGSDGWKAGQFSYPYGIAIEELVVPAPVGMGGC